MNKHRFLRLSVVLTLVAVIGISVGPISTRDPHSVLAGVCPPVPNTPLFTIVYGAVTLNSADAPVGTVVEARSPRDDVVGCFVVSEAGSYGTMYVYGEDISVSPPVPGMQPGEVIAFSVNSAEATASPELVWSNDHDVHQVDLSATSTTCYDFDGSGQVDVADVMLVANCWRMTTEDPDCAPYDLDGDGIITVVDIMKVVAHWGEAC